MLRKLIRFNSGGYRFRGILIAIGLLAMALVAGFWMRGGAFASKPSEPMGGIAPAPASLMAAPVLPSAPLAPDANMVVNGDFETGSLSPNWANFSPGTGVVVTSTTGVV